MSVYDPGRCYTMACDLAGGPEAADEFLAWALGPDHGSARIADSYELWNKEHPDAFQLKSNDLVTTSMIAMFIAYVGRIL